MLLAIVEKLRKCKYRVAYICRFWQRVVCGCIIPEVAKEKICSQVSAKTRTAPMKLTSVSRLELMAALIEARLAKFVVENHELKISKKYF